MCVFLRGGSGSLLAAGSAPRASQNRLRRPPGPKKKLCTRPGAPQGNFPAIFCPPQNRHPTPEGGARGVLPLHSGSLFLKNAAGASAGCKNRVSRVSGGHSWGWGEKLKLLQTTSRLVVLKLRCAKLEAPHAERRNAHTTARPVGRRISRIS